MRRVDILSPAATGPSAWVPVDNNVQMLQLSAYVNMNGAVLTYSVEVTYDDLMTQGAPTPVAFAGPAGLTAQSANAAAQISGPITGIRINVTAYTSGRARLSVIQQGLQ